MAGIHQIDRAFAETETELFHLSVDFEDVGNLGVEDDAFLLLVERDLYVVVVWAVHDKVKTDFDYLDCGFAVLAQKNAQVGLHQLLVAQREL